MLKIKIVAIGKMRKNDPLGDVYCDYIKRLPWDISLVELEEKRSLPEEKLKEKESQLLCSAISADSKLILLDEHGKDCNSKNFAKILKNWSDDGCNNISIAIGGAYGLGEEIKNRADIRLSFGKMTWPHMMVRAMLSEQLYRAHTIITNHPYHK
ncbi:23S rRNA (pseudouridine(1915)-N(3))-methyltransferase RlmH [Rickettsiales bacterium]|nr:23S rRNA (pseudouridine(1915)-N(3))-methyltransferase RlmH [Rickettsiales bacterium]